MEPFVVSRVIGDPFRHGFSTRAGASPPAHAALGCPVHTARQVHGARIVRVRAGDDPAQTAREQADGLCSDVAGLAVAVYAADCVPVLLADARTGAFAAVHAGWRGTVADIAAAAVAALGREFGSVPADLRVALGPSIGACCFEVGADVAAQFAADAVVARPGRKPHVDLRCALRAQLERAGVPRAFIDDAAACTKCDAENRFFSYRRDGRTGQQTTFVTRL